MWTETWQQTKSLGSQLFAVWKFDTFKWILWLLCLIYGAGEYISDINLLLISPQKFWLVWWTSLYLFCCCCGYFAKQQLDFHTYRLNPHLSKHHTPSPAHFLYVELFFFLTGRPPGRAGWPLLWRELAAVVLQPGVVDPTWPVFGLRAHANGGFPPGHQTAAGKRIQTQR